MVGERLWRAGILDLHILDLARRSWGALRFWIKGKNPKSIKGENDEEKNKSYRNYGFFCSGDVSRLPEGAV
jgi:hypothetical protein